MKIENLYADTYRITLESGQTFDINDSEAGLSVRSPDKTLVIHLISANCLTLKSQDFGG